MKQLKVFCRSRSPLEAHSRLGASIILGASFVLSACQTAQTPPAPPSATPPPVSLESGRELTDLFAARLKQALGSALQQGGAVAGIQVCHELAPKIANDVSTEYGVDFKRVSLRMRNPNNRPGFTEAETLTAFEAELASGAAVSSLESLDTEAVAGPRYMRAIPTQPLCLTCHGQPAPEVQAALDQLYPQDQATGYQLGDLRGAFVVTWPQL